MAVVEGSLFEDAGFAPALVPAADVYETDDEYVVELEVPGYEERELSIEVTDHTLTVRGEQTKATEEKKRSYRLHERLERSFERQFALPPKADPGFEDAIRRGSAPRGPPPPVRVHVRQRPSL